MKYREKTIILGLFLPGLGSRIPLVLTKNFARFLRGCNCCVAPHVLE
jgi:hypothetical protein